MYNITLKNILLLNKNYPVNEKVQSILEANQLTVVNIQGFCEAIAYLTEKRVPQPDLVLLDLDLPEVSGASEVEQLQAIAPDVPIIALVSPQQEETDNGVAALTHLCSVTAQQKFYDAVLIDLQMLKMERDFCSQIMRIKPALNQTKLILMTSITEK